VVQLFLFFSNGCFLFFLKKMLSLPILFAVEPKTDFIETHEGTQVVGYQSTMPMVLVSIKSSEIR